MLALREANLALSIIQASGKPFFIFSGFLNVLQLFVVILLPLCCFHYVAVDIFDCVP